MLVSITRIKKWGKEGNVEKLLEALQSEDSELRKAICLSLGETKSADALLALRFIERNDPDVFVQMTANKAIHHMIDHVTEMPHIQFVSKSKISYTPATN